MSNHAAPTARRIGGFAHPTAWILSALGLVLLALHKPWALTKPQLWAEDGSIFLTFNDLDGVRAFAEPYMGYLHAIPRLVAWTASHLLDPAWWPAFYNWCAFAIAGAVIARTFSSRLELPFKPWLALAFLIGPQTGEILFTITNIQWFTAVLLVEQAIIAPPRHRLDRVSDLLIVFLAGLTGPFVVAFWPLLAWRSWRERTQHNFAVLAVAGLCACVQGWFVLTTGPKFIWPPFAAGKFLEIVGQHLFGWALLGTKAAVALPPAGVALLGLLPAIALIGWSLRPHPRRELRATLVAAFALILIASVYRSRPDTWRFDDLDFSDRYFFLPRLLLYWLLILEFDAGIRWIRYGARGAVVAIAIMHLPHYRLPAPIDYHWSTSCDPIRRGVPAKIPILPEGWTLEYRGRSTPGNGGK